VLLLDLCGWWAFTYRQQTQPGFPNSCLLHCLVHLLDMFELCRSTVSFAFPVFYSHRNELGYACVTYPCPVKYNHQKNPALLDYLQLPVAFLCVWGLCCPCRVKPGELSASHTLPFSCGCFSLDWASYSYLLSSTLVLRAHLKTVI
jgi:hypothetical protein